MSFFLLNIGLLASFVALTGWYYFQNRAPWGNLFRNALPVSLGLYLVGWFGADAAFAVKVPVLFRDLLVLGAAGVVLRILLSRPLTFFITAAAIFGTLVLFFQNKHRFPLPNHQVLEQLSGLDAQGELLVELPEGRGPASLDELVKKYDLTVTRAFYPQSESMTELDDYYLVNVPDQHLSQLSAIQSALMDSGLADWTEGNETISIAPIEANRPTPAPNKYGINDPGVEQQWGFEAMKVDQLYAYLTRTNLQPNKKALIAILDTGVDAGHEDIKANYRSVKKSHDNDPKSHGTHCAGIAGAVSNNGVGVASLAKDNNFVEITSIKVLNASGMGTQQSILQGIIEAADNGASVISMSLGGFSNQSKQTAYEKAVKYAADKGAIVVAAAGNANRSAVDYSPANVKGVIAVSAIDRELNRAAFSNYVNALSMGVAAPGVDIYSTVPGQKKYDTFSGTSMATPAVAGLVGMMKSLRPDLTSAQAFQILKDTGTNTRNTADTGKLVQPADALKKLTGK